MGAALRTTLSATTLARSSTSASSTSVSMSRTSHSSSIQSCRFTDPILRTRSRPASTRPLGKVGPRVDVAGLRLEGRDVRQVERLPEPPHRRALDRVGPHGVERRRRHGHRQVRPSAVDEDRAVAPLGGRRRRWPPRRGHVDGRPRSAACPCGSGVSGASDSDAEYPAQRITTGVRRRDRAAVRRLLARPDHGRRRSAARRRPPRPSGPRDGAQGAVEQGAPADAPGRPCPRRRAARPGRRPAPRRRSPPRESRLPARPAPGSPPGPHWGRCR